MLHHSLVSGEEADDFGATPVHDAAEHGQLESLQVFYEHSVNMEMSDCDGLTPKYVFYGYVKKYSSLVTLVKLASNNAKQNIYFLLPCCYGLVFINLH